jgi:hypothetical protein
MILGTTLGSENDRKTYFFDTGRADARVGRADIHAV